MHSDAKIAAQLQRFDRLQPETPRGLKSDLACHDTLALERTCSRLSTVPFAKSPKRSMGHVLGAETIFFLIRGRGRPTVCGGRACGILSIPVKQVSVGSPRVGTIHAQAPTPHAPPLQDSFANVAGGAFREARGYVPGPLLSNIWSRRTTRMYSEFGSCF